MKFDQVIDEDGGNLEIGRRSSIDAWIVRCEDNFSLGGDYLGIRKEEDEDEDGAEGIGDFGWATSDVFPN